MKRANDYLADNYDSYEESWNLLGHLIDQKECEKAVQLLSEDENLLKEADDYYKEFDDNNYRRITKYLRHEKRKTLIRDVIPHVLKGIAVIVCILSMGTGIAIASSATVRAYLRRLMMVTTPEYTTIWTEQNEEASAGIPDGWNGKFFPMAVPAGLHIGQMSSSKNDSFIMFRNSKGERVLTFDETVGGVINLDTEGTVIEDVEINGQMGHVASKEDSINVFWVCEDTLLLMITENTSFEETMRIAKSVSRVSR